MTGGRLKRVKEFVKDDELFCFTYGDGVSDIDFTAELAFHKKHQRLATVGAVQPPGRYGSLKLDQSNVLGFQEKPQGDGGWINAGFFILSPEVIDRISSDQTTWEVEPLESLAQDGQLQAYFHDGFWQPMDTLRDKNTLEALWSSGKAPWKTWD
jgi:glucose-1-phosphate cytidylyltransferase